MTDEGFILRFPFKPLHWVTGLESGVRFDIGGLKYSLVANKPYLVIKVQPFSTEQDALEFIPRLWGALAMIAVELRTGFVVEPRVDAVTYYEAPDETAVNFEKSFGLPNTGPIHGVVSGQEPSILPIGKNIRVFTFGEVTGTVTYTADRYAPELATAMGRANIGALYADARLRTAIELLCDAQREVSIRSKFLTHIIALEVLADRISKHKVVQDLLDDLNARTETLLGMYCPSSNEYHSLESLQRELMFRREGSLRSSIRRLVLEALSDLPEEALYMRSKEIVWAYDLRGTLVHDGTVPAEDLHRAHAIVYQALLDVLARRIDGCLES